MHRGVELAIYVSPGLGEDNFVATAIGNLASFRLQEERGEHLEWQVVRVDGGGQHHYRLVVRHPDRALDLGFKSRLESILHDLSNESLGDLRKRLKAAEASGLKLVPLRHAHEQVDYWRDDFWNHIG